MSTGSLLNRIAAPGSQLNARPSVKGYLEHVKHTNRPIINDRYYYADGSTCVVEFDVDLGDDRTVAIVDVFTLNDDGEIARLAVYRR